MNNQNWTLIQSASLNGHLEIVKYLCECFHLNTEIYDNIGNPLLHLAS